MMRAAALPYQGTMAGFRRFSVAEYHKLIELGILTEDDNLELLDGYLVHKMSRNPPHDSCLHLTLRAFLRVLPAGWSVRIQSAVTLSDSEPEPDIAAVRGDERRYTARHPGSADVGVVVEVSDSTLPGDRDDKGRIYAAAGIPSFWIINLVDRQVEVYTSPSGPAAQPGFSQRSVYRTGDSVPLVLDGTTVAQIAVQDLLP
jgi:hypothetical protein